MKYDNDNIFAKIIRKELPCDLIRENKNTLAFKDISPRAPVHILIVPKAGYVNYHDFIANSSIEEITDLIEGLEIKMFLIGPILQGLTEGGWFGSLSEGFNYEVRSGKVVKDWGETFLIQQL